MTDTSTSRSRSHTPFPIPDWDLTFPILLRAVSGTYRSNEPANSGQILELRVDVDGRRPQQRLSGDFFTKFSIFGFSFTLYTGSFVVESVEVTLDSSEAVIGGPVVYYSDATNTGDEIEVHMPRANIFSPAPAACVTLRSGSTVSRPWSRSGWRRLPVSRRPARTGGGAADDRAHSGAWWTSITLPSGP